MKNTSQPNYCPGRMARVGLLALLQAALVSPTVLAEENDDIASEMALTQFMVIDNQKRQNIDSDQADNDKTDSAILPQIGVDPDVGFIMGGKYSVINMGDSHANLDIGATQSTGGETVGEVSWGVPELAGTDLVGLVQARFTKRSRQQYYGLGNNRVGDDQILKHRFQRAGLDLTLGKRLAPNWMAAASIGFEHVKIGATNRNHGTRAQVDAFEDLPGHGGGFSNPVSLSILYNNRDDLTRPDRGLSAVGKVTHVGPELGSDFKYTKVTADARYVYPIFSSKNLVGLRINGQYNFGSNHHLPYYDMASIGGYDSLEGFNSNRFIGQGRIFARLGFQRMLAEFDFRDWWHVRLDGSLFGGAGRVFLDRSKLPHHARARVDDIAPGVRDKVQFSYGGGLNIALDQALTARIDAGFSGESKGLIYLAFGHAF